MKNLEKFTLRPIDLKLGLDLLVSGAELAESQDQRIQKIGQSYATMVPNTFR